MHGVARGARLIERHHPVLAEQTVDQRALAHVGPADDRDLDAGRSPARRAGSGVEPVQRRLQQRHHALIVRGGDRMRLAEPELMKIRHGDVGVESLGLVDRQHHGLAAAPRQLRHELVLGRQARASVDQHDQPVGLGDGSLGLRDHQALDRVGVLHQPARVDHDAGNFCAARESVLPIAREPGEVRDQRVARARHRVEQGSICLRWVDRSMRLRAACRKGYCGGAAPCVVGASGCDGVAGIGVGSAAGCAV